jgi:hypothetical protein
MLGDVQGDAVDPLVPKRTSLGPEGRLNVTRVLIKKFIEENPDGTTAKSIAGRLGLSYLTVSHHLDHLVATRELYVHAIGPRTRIYYPNGRLSHPYARSNFSLKDQMFKVQLIDNPRGKFVYIQELQNSGIQGKTIAGGIIIRLDGLPDFVSELQAFISENRTHREDEGNGT